MADVLTLTSTTTVARMLERDDFQGRYREGRPISIVEFLYPLMQGYDSVAIKADVELGGTDQTFNLMMGREVQRSYGLEPQVVFTMPLLEGTDGVRKMSKSYDNYVGLTDSPEQMFGRVMSVPDGLLGRWFQLCTELPAADIDGLEQGLGDGSVRPADAKRRLAREIISLYHDPAAAAEAEERFDRVHRDHEVPDDVPERAVPEAAVKDGRVWLPRLLVELGLASSNSDARRLVSGGGVKLDGVALEDPEAELPLEDLVGRVLQVGRRRFARVARTGRVGPMGEG